MSTILTFELTLKSDYHVGSGHRKSTGVDSALLREADKRPALRGSLLGQLLRDSARELLATAALNEKKYARCAASDGRESPRYCQQWEPDEPECPICWVFGSPRRPRRWQFSSAWLKEAGEAKPISEVPDGWGAQPTTRVRVSPYTRRAEPDKLFNEEVGDGRLVFRFEAHWNGPGQPDKAEIALLAAAARNLWRIGKGRRRGRGECRAQLVSVSDQSPDIDWLSRFKEEWIDKTWIPVSRQEKKRPPALLEEKMAAPEWQPVRVRVIARLDEPVLVARRALAGNQFDGLTTMLPGNVLLGALAGRAARKDLDNPEIYRTFTGLFRRGWARFSFLALARASEAGDLLYSSFAAPLDVFRCKQYPPSDPKMKHNDRSFALLGDAKVLCEQCVRLYGEDNGAVEGLDELLTLESGDLKKFEPYKREEMHIRLMAETQRVETGILFGYVALEAGQYLCGEIVCQDAVTWEALREMADLPTDGTPLALRLGKGTRRGYGRVTVTFDAPESAPVLSLVRDRLPDPKQPFTLLLASDTIIMDTWGRFPAGFEAGWLSEALGVQVEMIRGFAKSRDVDTFNGHLGLPRWRDRALRAGSAVGLRVVDESLSPNDIWKKLEEVEAKGIGLRRGEGFGQVIVNHSIYATLAGTAADISIEINCPEVLRSKADITGNPIEVERKFREKRARDMGDKWEKMEHAEFMAVARLLYSGRDLPIETLKHQLGLLGQPDLGRLPGKRMPMPSDHVSAPRERKESFKEKVKPGLEFIEDLLTALEKTEDARLRSIGVEMLATKVAEAADRALNKEKSR